MGGEEAVVFAMMILVLGGISVLWMSMHYRRRFREMVHRERLAMIDRGLIPPPETDPGRFEQQSGLQRPESQAAARTRSIGVVMIGLGLAFMVLLTFAADSPESGVGIGGAFAMLGAAFLFNSFLMRSHEPYGPLPQRTEHLPRPAVESPRDSNP